MEEIEFNNSPLQVVMVNAKSKYIFYLFTEKALSKQPESKFWKDAFELIKVLREKEIEKNRKKLAEDVKNRMIQYELEEEQRKKSNYVMTPLDLSILNDKDYGDYRQHGFK